MFLWVAVDLDSQLTQIKNECVKIEKELGFSNSTHFLPMHISLKISFEIKREFFTPAVNLICDYLKSLKPFTVKTSTIEVENDIVWIKFISDDILNKIHSDLDKLLLQNFNVPLHPYDNCFIFHSTLFFGGNKLQTETAFRKIKNFSIPQNLTANKFVLGASDSGNPVTYSVIKQFEI